MADSVERIVLPVLPVEHGGARIVWAAWTAHVNGSAAACGRTVMGPVLCSSCCLDGGMWRAAGKVDGEQRVHAKWCEWCGELIVAWRHDPPAGKWVGRFETIHHVPSSAGVAPAVEG